MLADASELGQARFSGTPGHLELPAVAEGPPHCHPPGPGLEFWRSSFSARSISETGGHPS